MPSTSNTTQPRTNGLAATRRAARGYVVLTMFILAMLSACHSGPRNYLNENDRLRRENLALNEKAVQLEQRVASQNRVIAAQQKQLARKEGLPPPPDGVQRPVPARLEIGSISGGIDTDGDGHDDALRLYLRTRDQQERFIQVIGRVSITAAALPPGSDAVTVATQTVDAAQLDAAYRSGLAGTHYTLQILITGEVPVDVTTLSVSIELKDLLHGQTLRTETALRFQP